MKNAELNINKYIELRKTLNYTQETIAKKINKSRNTIINWENGKHKPSSNDLVNLSSALKVDIRDITLNTEKNINTDDINDLISNLNGLISEFGDFPAQFIPALNDLKRNLKILLKENYKLNSSLNSKDRILNSIPYPIYIINNNLRITYSNSSFAFFLNKKSEDIYNKKWSNFFPYNEITELINYQREAFEKEEILLKEVKILKSHTARIKIIPHEYDLLNSGKLKSALCIIEGSRKISK